MDLSSCICCWTGINALLYLASAIVQWVLIGKKSADGVACVHGVALAGAILSSLATLFSFILAFCSCCCQQGTTKARRCNWLLQYLQLSVKLGALICTAVMTANRIDDDCGTAADPGDHPELHGLIIAAICLESVSTFLSSMIQCCNICYACQQKKRTQSDRSRQDDEDEPLINNKDGKQPI